MNKKQRWEDAQWKGIAWADGAAAVFKERNIELPPEWPGELDDILGKIEAVVEDKDESRQLAERVLTSAQVRWAEIVAGKRPEA